MAERKKDDVAADGGHIEPETHAPEGPTEEIADATSSASHESNTYSDPAAYNDTPMSELLPPDPDDRAKVYKCNICGSALDVYKGSESAHKQGTGFCEKCGERRLLQK